MKHLENHQLEFLSNSLWHTNIDIRAREALNAYRNKKVTHVYEFLFRSDKYLLGFDSFGIKKLASVKKLFSDRGLNLDALRDELGWVGKEPDESRLSELENKEFSDAVFSIDYKDATRERLLGARENYIREVTIAFLGEERAERLGVEKIEEFVAERIAARRHTKRFANEESEIVAALDTHGWMPTIS